MITAIVLEDSLYLLPGPDELQHRKQRHSLWQSRSASARTGKECLPERACVRNQRDAMTEIIQGLHHLFGAAHLRHGLANPADRDLFVVAGAGDVGAAGGCA